MIANALKKKLEADVEAARSDLEVFLNNPIGVAEHIDYIATAEKKLEHLIIKNIFWSMPSILTLRL